MQFQFRKDTTTVSEIKDAENNDAPSSTLEIKMTDKEVALLIGAGWVLCDLFRESGDNFQAAVNAFRDALDETAATLRAEIDELKLDFPVPRSHADTQAMIEALPHLAGKCGCGLGVSPREAAKMKEYLSHKTVGDSTDKPVYKPVCEGNSVCDCKGCS